MDEISPLPEEESPPGSRPHLSPSAIGMFLRCGESYRRRYVEKERIPPGIKMIRGTAYHTAAAENFKQKVASHQDLPEADLMDMAAEAINLARKGEWLHDGEGDPARAWGEAKDEAVNAASVFARQVAPEYQPLLVEERIKIALPGSHDMLGIVDLVDDRQRVTDHKTTQRAKSQQEADGSLQLSFYAAAYRARFGQDPAEVRLDVVTTSGKRAVLRSTRDYSDYQRLAAVTNMVLASIAAGLFTPAEPTAWWCSPRWCGYANSCPYYAGKRQALGPDVYQIKAAAAEPEAAPPVANGEAAAVDRFMGVRTEQPTAASKPAPADRPGRRTPARSAAAWRRKKTAAAGSEALVEPGSQGPAADAPAVRSCSGAPAGEF